jgi:hypothetical protein
MAAFMVLLERSSGSILSRLAWDDLETAPIDWS